MANLPKFTLVYDRKKDDWALENDRSDRIWKRFETKAEATEGGVLKDLLGANGGSVKIQKEDGTFQEERTYPSSKDPHSSPG